MLRMVTSFAVRTDAELVSIALSCVVACVLLPEGKMVFAILDIMVLGSKPPVFPVRYLLTKLLPSIMDDECVAIKASLEQYLLLNHLGLLDDDTADPDNYVHVLGSVPALRGLAYLRANRVGIHKACAAQLQHFGNDETIIAVKCCVVTNRDGCEIRDFYNEFGWLIETKFSVSPDAMLQKCADNPFDNTADFSLFTNAILCDDISPVVFVTHGDTDLMALGGFSIRVIHHTEHRLQMSPSGVCTITGDSVVGLYRLIKSIPAVSLCLSVDSRCPVDTIRSLLSVLKGDVFDGQPTYVRVIVSPATFVKLNLTTLVASTVSLPMHVKGGEPQPTTDSRKYFGAVAYEMLRQLGDQDTMCPAVVCVHLFEHVLMAFPKPDPTAYTSTCLPTEAEEKMVSYCDVVSRGFTFSGGKAHASMQICRVSCLGALGKFGRAANVFNLTLDPEATCVRADLTTRNIVVPSVAGDAAWVALLIMLDAVQYFVRDAIVVVLHTNLDTLCSRLLRLWLTYQSPASKVTLYVYGAMEIMAVRPGSAAAFTYTLPDWSVDTVPVELYRYQDEGYSVGNLMAQDMATQPIDDEIEALAALLRRNLVMDNAVWDHFVFQEIVEERPTKLKHFVDSVHPLRPAVLKALFTFCDYAIDRDNGVVLPYVNNPNRTFQYYRKWYNMLFADVASMMADLGEDVWLSLTNTDSITDVNSVSVGLRQGALTQTLADGDFASSFNIGNMEFESQLVLSQREKVISDPNFLTQHTDQAMQTLVCTLVLSEMGVKLMPPTPKLHATLGRIQGEVPSAVMGLKCIQRPPRFGAYLKVCYDEACYLGWRSRWHADTDVGHFRTSDALRCFYQFIHPNVLSLHVGACVSSYELKPVCQDTVCTEFERFAGFLEQTTDIVALSPCAHMVYRQMGAACVCLKDMMLGLKANVLLLLLATNRRDTAALTSRLLRPVCLQTQECARYVEWIPALLDAYSRTFGPVYLFERQAWRVTSSLGELQAYKLVDVMVYSGTIRDVYIRHSETERPRHFMLAGVSPMLYVKGVGPMSQSVSDNLPLVVDNVMFRTNAEQLKLGQPVVWPDPVTLGDVGYTHGTPMFEGVKLNGLKDPLDQVFCPTLPPPPVSAHDLTVVQAKTHTVDMFEVNMVNTDTESEWEIKDIIVRTASYAEVGSGNRIQCSGLAHDIRAIEQMQYKCLVVARPPSVAFFRFINRIVCNASESMWQTGFMKVKVKTIVGPLCPMYRRQGVGLLLIAPPGHVAVAKTSHLNVDTVVSASQLIPLLLKNVLSYTKTHIRCGRLGQTLVIQRILAAVAVLTGFNPKHVTLSTPEGPGAWLQSTYGATGLDSVEVVYVGEYVGVQANCSPGVADAIKHSNKVVLSPNNYTVMFHDTDSKYKEAKALQQFTPRQVHHILLTATSTVTDPNDVWNRIAAYEANNNVSVVSRLTLNDVVTINTDPLHAEKVAHTYLGAAIACDGAVLGASDVPWSERAAGSESLRCENLLIQGGFIQKHYVDIMINVIDEMYKAQWTVRDAVVAPAGYKTQTLEYSVIYNNNVATSMHLGGIRFDFGDVDRVSGVRLTDTKDRFGVNVQQDGTITLAGDMRDVNDVWKRLLVIMDIRGTFPVLKLNAHRTTDQLNTNIVIVCKLLACMHKFSKTQIPFSKVRILGRSAAVDDFIGSMTTTPMYYNGVCYTFAHSLDYRNDQVLRKQQHAPLTTVVSYTRLTKIHSVICDDMPQLKYRQEFAEDVELGAWVTVIVFLIAHHTYVPSDANMLQDILRMYTCYVTEVQTI